LSICSRRIKVQKHRKTKVLTDLKLVILRGKFAVAVQRFNIIGPGLTASGSRIRGEPFRAGDAIGVTRSANCPRPGLHISEIAIAAYAISSGF
jgi:hypothetical protein